MRKVLFIFADSSVKKGLADAEKLREIVQHEADLENQDLKVFVTYARSLSYFVSNDHSVIYDHRNRRDLKDYDFVYFRKAGSVMQQMLSCAVYLKQHGIPFVDQEIFTANSRNKLSQMFKLQSVGVSIPVTFFCRHKTRMLRLIRTKFKSELQFPLIAKATGGTRGDENYLIKSLEELEQLIRNSHRHFLIQAFVPNDGDYRVLVMNGGIKGVIRRLAQNNSHLNNTSQGGEAIWLEPTELSDVVRQEAVLSANVLKRDIAGVDIILDKNTGQHYVLEVNRAPQIENASFPEKKAKLLLRAINRSIQNHVPTAANVISLGQEKVVIGRFEKMVLPGDHEVIAKIDTGADTSSVHCERIELTDTDGERLLRYSFDKTGDQWFETHDFSDKLIKSSNGQTSHRYQVMLDVVIGTQNYACSVTLSNRQAMAYGVLLGRRFLRDNKMIVDVARRFVLTRQKGKLNI